MKAKLPTLLVVCSLVCAAVAGAMLGPRRGGAQLLSPGKLTSDHAEIDGDANCSRCHSSGKRLDTQACLSCHEDLGARIKAKAGLHGRQYRGQDCGSCHVEHLGREAKLVRWPGGSKEKFQHREAGWALKGAHQKLECQQCHDGRNERGHPTYLGLKTSCTSCHEDPHDDRFGDKECTSCHNETDWTEVSNVADNHPGLSLAAGHAKVECQQCHDQGNVKPPSEGSACVSCHQEVHEAKLGTRCENCHASIRWAPLPRRIGLRMHSSTPFPLTGNHRDVACKRCHRSNLPADRRYRGLQFDDCTDCHKDPHKGAFADWVDDADCSSCHDEHGFWPTLFTVEQHAHAEFPLNGRHQAVPCSACHEGKRPRLSLTMKARECADCHDNPHGEQFSAEMSQGGCAQCHSESGWESPRIDHSVWPLTGAHAEAACESCHSPSQSDRKQGRGATYRGAPTECSGCHRDVHAGQFRLSPPELACEACHDTQSFELASFDHETMADYPLEGGHADLACESCHAEERLRNGDKVTRYRLGYRACADCHADPHSRGKGKR
jgi:hypothetical protein